MRIQIVENSVVLLIRKDKSRKTPKADNIHFFKMTRVDAYALAMRWSNCGHWWQIIEFERPRTPERAPFTSGLETQNG